jgi:hypothetical protein
MGEAVLDPFMGLGTTIITAHRSKRVAYGIELDPGFVDVGVRPWEQETGLEAVHAVLQLSFGEFAAKRQEIADVQTDDNSSDRNHQLIHQPDLIRGNTILSNSKSKSGNYSAGYKKPPISGQFKSVCH